MSSTRRDFLKTSLGTAALASLGPMVPAVLGRPACAAGITPDAGETILVVVQLAGGNDGLNTLVPFEDDVYARNRPTLRMPPEKVHKIDDLLGFHPNMTAFARLYREGRLGVVQGVGYPNPSGDHDASMRYWQTARPHQDGCQTGWLGRAVDHARCPDDASVPAVFVGQIKRPLTVNGETAIVPTIRSLKQNVMEPMPGPEEGPAHQRRLVEAARLPRPGQDNPLLGFLQRSSVDAYAVGRRLEEAARTATSDRTAEYPAFQVARDFHTVAQLIRADLGIRIYYTELGGEGPGGFDNHANQLGNHCALLRQLSESVAAFVDDLARDKLLDRVLLMTFSEFGRTVKENGRRGTGHGSAAPMFLAGGCLKGGMAGEHPNLTDLENGGQKFHTDFRRVYATVLDRWLGFDSRAVLGETFEPLDVLRV
ncbi:MAG: DUF1501 domain-containing protein [Pirellulales bacterium]|nr:DUF1501 domain-containing protein [Pirellulales bacterium]